MLKFYLLSLLDDPTVVPGGRGVTEVDGDGPSGGHVEVTPRPSGLGFLPLPGHQLPVCHCPRTRINPKLGHHLTVDVHGEVMPAPDVGGRRPGLSPGAGAVNTIVSCQGCGKVLCSLPGLPAQVLCAGCWDGQGAWETVH